MNNVSSWEQRRRKALLVLPILVIPLVTLAFWALGGGKGDGKGASAGSTGLNLSLPEANQKKETGLDKLRFYEAADRDSAAWRQKVIQDRYSLGYREDPLEEHNRSKESAYIYDPAPTASSRSSAETEKLIYQKLGEINRQVAKAEAKPGSSSTLALKQQTDPSQMVALQKHTTPGTREQGEDEDLVELNQMMEKILDIQHPERVKEKLQQASAIDKEQAFAVIRNNDDNNTSLQVNKSASLIDIATNNESANNGFFTLNDAIESTTKQQSLIQATIHETQTVVEGAVVKLRLLNEVFINSRLIPKGTFVFGMATLSRERLNIAVNSIHYRNDLFPVQLSVVDLDGIDGIYIPGAITRDVAKGSAEQAIQGIGITSLNPSVGAQAAAAGIEATKTLLSRKARLVKVTLKAGYQVLLKDDKEKTSYNP